MGRVDSEKCDAAAQWVAAMIAGDELTQEMATRHGDVLRVVVTFTACILCAFVFSVF